MLKHFFLRPVRHSVESLREINKCTIKFFSQCIINIIFLEIISVDKKVNLLLITDVKRQLITVITQVN